MRNFLADLCFYCTADIGVPRSAKYEQSAAELARLEKEFTDRMGHDFATRYQQAAYEVTNWELETAFLRGLQFGVQPMLTALPPQ